MHGIVWSLPHNHCHGESLHRSDSTHNVTVALPSLCLAATAERQQGLAAYLLTQVPLMHAAAYTLAKVAELNSWRPVMEKGYELVPFSSCCKQAENLPRGFVQAVRSWGSTLGQEDTDAQPA